MTPDGSDELSVDELYWLVIGWDPATASWGEE